MDAYKWVIQTRFHSSHCCKPWLTIGHSQKKTNAEALANVFRSQAGKFTEYRVVRAGKEGEL